MQQLTLLPFFFGSSFSFIFPTSSASTSFVSRCTGFRDFARFVVGSLFFPELLCFLQPLARRRIDRIQRPVSSGWEKASRNLREQALRAARRAHDERRDRKVYSPPETQRIAQATGVSTVLDHFDGWRESFGRRVNTSEEGCQTFSGRDSGPLSFFPHHTIPFPVKYAGAPFYVKFCTPQQRKENPKPSAPKKRDTIDPPKEETMASTKSRGRRINGKGTFIYRDFQDNHVIWPGRERDLDQFLGQSFKGISHKRKNARSSNSEDALTWSCFDTLANVSQSRRALALEELWELAYGDMPAPDGLEASTIHIGKSYGVGKKITEVDLSFEGDGFLVLVEAKLYSPMSQADPDNDRPHNQIARKVTIGLRAAQATGKDFYFILLDIAPAECLAQLNPGVSLEKAGRKASGFGGKWLTSYWFSRYKYGRRGSLKPLRELLLNEGLDEKQVSQVAARMGWLTWVDVFKVVLRSVISTR